MDHVMDRKVESVKHDRRPVERIAETFARWLKPAFLAVALAACARPALAQGTNEAASKAESTPQGVTKPVTTTADLAALTQAVQAQVKAMEELRTRNEALARTNEELFRRIQALESRLAAPASEGHDPAVTKSASKVPADAGEAPQALSGTGIQEKSQGSAADSGPSPNTMPDIVVEPVPGQPILPMPDPVPPFSPFEPGMPGVAPEVPIVSSVPDSPVASVSIFQPLPKSDLGPSPTGTGAGAGDFFFGRYDNGYVLVAPKDPQKTPFAAKLNIVTQERYTGFARQVATWQPRNFPEPIPVNNRSTFDVNRAYIGFSGFAIDPRLRYSMIVATTSVVNVTYLLGVIGFQFDKAFGLYGGFNKVPGSREWLESFKHTLGSDRSMATTFFRPSMSPGVWVTGEPLTNFHYYGMISNSINSFDQFGDRSSTQMCYAGSLWWEPLGAFGPGFADEEFHESPVIRLGGSGLFTRQDREPLIENALQNPENTILRLSNGIPVFTRGALAPGVSLLATDDRSLALDAGLKYRGFSLSGEYYFRLLNNFRTDKPLPGLTSVADSGGYVQTSFALIPKKLEVFAKSSLVAGPFGSGNDYGGGLNWYVSGNRNWRITGEALQVNRSPASNILTPYRTGQSGTIVLMQLVTDF